MSAPTDVPTLETETWGCLIRLARAGLAYSPQVNEALLASWVENLVQLAELDDNDDSFQRLRVAVNTIIREDEKWPPMSRVLSLLPQKKQEPEPELTPEQAHAQWLDDLEKRFGPEGAAAGQAEVDAQSQRIEELRALLAARKKEPMSDKDLARYVYIETRNNIDISPHWGDAFRLGTDQLKWYDSHPLTRIVRMEAALERKSVDDDAGISSTVPATREPEMG